MKNMKKTSKIFISLLIIISFGAVFIQPASAALIGYDGFYFSLKSNKTAILEEFHGSGTAVEIPSSVYSYTVTTLAENVFSNNTSITLVNIPSSITSVGSYAFYGCSALKEVNYSDRASSINAACFYGCTSLEKAVIPESVTSISNNAFIGCSNLTIYCYENSYAQTYAQTKNISYRIIHHCPPLVNTSYVSDDVVETDNTKQVIVTAAAQGGTGDYSFDIYEKNPSTGEWQLNVSGVKPNSDNEYSVGVYALAVRKYYYKVVVTDSDDNTAEKELEFEVIPQSLKNISSVSADTVKAKSTVWITANAQGGTGDYLYSIYYSKNGGDWILKGKEFGTKNTATLCPNTYGTYQIKTVVKDSEGTEKEKIMDITVLPQDIENVSKLSADTVKVNTTVKITANAKNGTGDYSYSIYYRKNGGEWILKGEEFSSKNTATLCPNTYGTYQVKTVVKDSSGTQSEKIMDITVQPLDLQNISTISADNVKVNMTVKITANAKNGTGDYRYSIYYSKNGGEWVLKGEEFSSKNTATLCPNTYGTYQVKTVVKDSAGTQSEKIMDITVQPLDLENVSTISADKVPVKTTIKITAKAKNGTGDYRYSIYYRKNGGEWVLKGEEFSTKNTATLCPVSIGNYQVRTDVKDSSGSVVSKIFDIVSE